MAAPAASQAWKGRTAPPFLPGEEFGCWEIVRPAEPDTMGRARYEARARCCGRKVIKHRHDLLRRAPACSRCADRTGKGPRARPASAVTRTGRLNTCGACGQPGHKRTTCASRARTATEASPWVRCRLHVAVTTSAANTQAQGYSTCGALVRAHRRLEHLVEVHGLVGTEDEAVQHFAQVDALQGAGG